MNLASTDQRDVSTLILESCLTLSCLSSEPRLFLHVGARTSLLIFRICLSPQYLCTFYIDSIIITQFIFRVTFSVGNQFSFTFSSRFMSFVVPSQSQRFPKGIVTSMFVIHWKLFNKHKKILFVSLLSKECLNNMKVRY